MNADTATPSIQLTGQISEWYPLKGWGIIRSANRAFFAHAKHFIGHCACGQRHKCEIAPGMSVEFWVDQLDPRSPNGRLPAAFAIQVKP